MLIDTPIKSANFLFSESHKSFRTDGSPATVHERQENADLECGNNKDIGTLQDDWENCQNDLENCQNDLESLQNDLNPRVWESLLTESCGVAHWIAACGTPAMFEELLSRCPHTDVKNFPTQRSQLPPLVFAAQAANLAVVEVLMKTGCDVNALVSCSGEGTEEILEPLLVHMVKNGVVSCSVVETLLKTGTFDLNLADPHGMTPLRVAVKAGNHGYVTTLLSAGAHPNYSQVNPETDPTIFDVMSPEYDDSVTPRWKMVETLLTAGADPNWPHPIKHAPLYSAVMLGNAYTAAMLGNAIPPNRPHSNHQSG